MFDVKAYTKNFCSEHRFTEWEEVKKHLMILTEDNMKIVRDCAEDLLQYGIYYKKTEYFSLIVVKE